MTTSSPSSCARCGAPVSGKFCSECGAPARGATCPACASHLTPGARFCHHCGLAVGAPGTAPAAPASAARSAPAAGGGGNYLPWTIAVLAFVAVVAILAGQRFGSLGSARSEPPAGPMAGGPVAAPDISSMSPRERADRLFDRMMRLASEGKQDSVNFFAPMALSSYENLGPLDLDLRYDFGRVAEISNNLDVAGAQADSILKENPRHLLGLVLAGRVAELRGRTPQRDAFRKRLLEAQASELAQNRDEYARHKGDIDAAISAARSGK